MLEFEKETVQFKLEGEIHEVSKPSNIQIREYTTSLYECKDDKEREELLVEFLFKLGLSKEVYYKLTPAQTKKVIQGLYGTEKN